MMTVNKLYLEKVSKWAESIINQQDGYFIVEIKILQSNQFQVYIDADQGASINELARINKTLRKKIEDKEWFEDGKFSLDVSSPGLDEPLKKLRQYKKNIGREVDIVLTDGQKKKGVLTEVTEDTILLTYKPKKKKKGKKAKKEKEVSAPEYFTFDKIKTTKVCIGF